MDQDILNMSSCCACWFTSLQSEQLMWEGFVVVSEGIHGYAIKVYILITEICKRNLSFYCMTGSLTLALIKCRASCVDIIAYHLNESLSACLSLHLSIFSLSIFSCLVCLSVCLSVCLTVWQSDSLTVCSTCISSSLLLLSELLLSS